MTGLDIRDIQMHLRGLARVFFGFLIEHHQRVLNPKASVLDAAIIIKVFPQQLGVKHRGEEINQHLRLGNGEIGGHPAEPGGGTRLVQVICCHGKNLNAMS